MFLGGPKNYAFETMNGNTACKIRGFSLNHENSKKLNFTTLKSLVLHKNWTETIPIVNPSKITREVKRRKVVNREEIKNYRLVYNKRVICDDFSTLPYGY